MSEQASKMSEEGRENRDGSKHILFSQIDVFIFVIMRSKCHAFLFTWVFRLSISRARREIFSLKFSTFISYVFGSQTDTRVH